MITGIGTDICDIRRIERSIEKFGDRFLNKVFTQSERDYCEERSGRASYYAKRFAAKEAVAKALAGPKTGSLSWHDVEIAKDPSGRPTVNLYGEAQKRLERQAQNGASAHVHISLSDDHPYALAYAIVEVSQ